MTVEPVHARIGTREDFGAGGARRLDTLRPTAALTPFVTCFHAYAERDLVRLRRRELPDGNATMLFNLGDPVRIEHPVAVRRAFAGGAGFFSGASSTYAISEMEHDQRGVQVMLTPFGARRLLGMPLAEVGDRLTDPADLFGPAIGETLDRLLHARTHLERLAVLEHAVAVRVMDERPGPPPDVAWALDRLRATQGRARIDRLAASIGCSRKHLTVRFTREFGMAPKAMGRVLRFGHAIRRIRRGDAHGWADLAAACGYADQSHLGRDVRAMAGCSPRALASRALPDDAGFVD